MAYVFSVKSFNDGLDDNQVHQWLAANFEDSDLYQIEDLSAISECTTGARNMDTPVAINAFEEDRNSVDFYTKAMLTFNADEQFSSMLEYTSFTSYWGAAMYLRRLLAEQTADLGTASTTPSSPVTADASPLGRQMPTQRSLTIDFNDAFFWRELGTYLALSRNTSTLDAVWDGLKDAYNNTDIAACSSLGCTVATLQTEAANKSGLSVAELNTIPAPIFYKEKSTVANNSGSGIRVDDLGMQSLGFTQQKLVSIGDYVVFGPRPGTPGAQTCLNGTAVYVLTAVPDNPAGSTQLNLALVTFDPNNPLRDLAKTAEPIKRAATIAPVGARAFFFTNYFDAAKHTCDPGVSHTARRRQLLDRVVPFPSDLSVDKPAVPCVDTWGTKQCQRYIPMHMSCADAGGRCDLSCGVCAVREAWMDAIQTETTTSTRRRLADSCRYANDGECDEPRWCRAGTDDTDCGRDTSWMEYLALVTKGANACTSARPCARCHGDCDTDRDCAGNLICFQRGSFEHIPSCHEGGYDGWDYCYNKATALKGLGWSYCTRSRPCPACSGDCDYDGECAGALKCFQRQRGEWVRGCAKGGGGDHGYYIQYDYCYDPAAVGDPLAASRAALAVAPGAQQTDPKDLWTKLTTQKFDTAAVAAVKAMGTNPKFDQAADPTANCDPSRNHYRGCRCQSTNDPGGPTHCYLGWTFENILKGSLWPNQDCDDDPDGDGLCDTLVKFQFCKDESSKVCAFKVVVKLDKLPPFDKLADHLGIEITGEMNFRALQQDYDLQQLYEGSDRPPPQTHTAGWACTR
jgi:hypothetical protein